MSANIKASTDGTQAIIGVGGVDQMTVSNAGVVTANSFVGLNNSSVTATGSTTARTLANRFADVVNVLDYGADPTGVVDSAPAFNLATKAASPHGGNADLSIRRVIFVPPGDYIINGTVYVRKGQMLTGAGDGTSKITTQVHGSGITLFKLGYGIPLGIETEDGGGLPPVIENIHTYLGDTVVDMRVAGAQARNLFISGPGIGIRLSGADTIVSNCLFDQGANGMVINGQNHIISSCHFFNLSYGIAFNNNSYDIQVNGCIFNYSFNNDILISDSVVNAQNISIQNCQFLKNAQYTTSDYGINIRSNNADLFIHGCEFRNQRGYSIGIDTGVNNNLRVSNCVFNGNISNQTYQQSTTAAGILTQNGNTEITNCRFENLFGPPITVNSILNYTTLVHGCTYKNISYSHFTNITATDGEIVISNCIGDDTTPLINLQSAIRPKLKSNLKWLGLRGNSSGRFFWKIPITGSAITNVGITANAFPGGSLNYRDTSSIYAVKSIDYNTGTLVFNDIAAKSTIYETSGNTLIGPLNIQVDLDSVGGGSVLPYVNQGRYIVVSVPNSYLYIDIQADFVN